MDGKALYKIYEEENMAQGCVAENWADLSADEHELWDQIAIRVNQEAGDV